MPLTSLFLPTIMIETRMQWDWHDFGAIKEK